MDSFLTKTKAKITYEERISSLSKGTQLAKAVAERNFKKFCKDEYEGRSHLVVIKEMSAIQKTDPDSVYEVIQKWVNWNNKRLLSPASLRAYKNNLKTLLRFHGVKLSKEDLNDNVSTPTIHEEELHPCSIEEIKKILDVSTYKVRGLYLGLLSSGLRPVEISKIRVQDLDMTKKRIVVHVPAKITKLRRSKITFFSKEAKPYILGLCKNKSLSDYVFGGSTIGIDIGFKRAYKRAGFEDKYEHNNRNKITPMSLRAYFITKLSRKDPNLAKILAGQKGYLLQYDRLSEDDKLELYLEFENELLIYEQKQLVNENKFDALQKKVDDVTILLKRMFLPRDSPDYEPYDETVNDWKKLLLALDIENKDLLKLS